MLGTEDEPGIYMLAARDVFDTLTQPKYAHLELRVSSYEIYASKVYDLLNNRAVCPIREDARKRVNVVGLSETAVSDLTTYRSVLMLMAEARRTAATCAHAESSRSHACLQLTLRARSSGAATERPSLDTGHFRFVDLAGTERGADREGGVLANERERRLEGAEINKSLLALKECIRSLDSGKSHIPFRGAKLTEVLRDSFVGDCHTVMIGTIAPTRCAPVEPPFPPPSLLLPLARRAPRPSAPPPGTRSSPRSTPCATPRRCAPSARAAQA